MQYKNYEKDIVLRYGVELVGWTHEQFACPSSLPMSIEPLRALRDALETGECKFRRLTHQEMQERQRAYNAKVATSTVKARKVRSDKGKSHASRKRAAVELGDAEGVGEESAPRKRARAGNDGSD